KGKERPQSYSAALGLHHVQGSVPASRGELQIIQRQTHEVRRNPLHDRVAGAVPVKPETRAPAVRVDVVVERCGPVARSITSLTQHARMGPVPTLLKEVPDSVIAAILVDPENRARTTKRVICPARGGPI